jgi:hypothetical protein
MEKGGDYRNSDHRIFPANGKQGTKGRRSHSKKPPKRIIKSIL